MIKSIFVGLGLGLENYKGLSDIGANHLIVVLDSIDKNKWNFLKKLGCTLGISLNCFGKDGCPADPRAFEKLKVKIKNALKWGPGEIWLDHFRFDGHWEAIKDNKIPDIHQECGFCAGRNRVKILESRVKAVKEIFSKIKIGYFAVPLRKDEFPEIISGLGQDHKFLGKIFDMTSPMLYHRMIGKPVSYISEYVSYISKFSNSVMPIIQIKDMPDDLPDELSWEEVKAAYEEARKPPSKGVSIFIWEHAIEKNKIELIKELFSSI